MFKAQCLARLGRAPEAAALVADVLRQNPDDPDFHFAAALVYSVIGDHNSALINAREALERGKSPHWFTAFRALQGDPEMRKLLAAFQGPG